MHQISFYIAFLFVITGCLKQDSGKAGAVGHPHYSIDLNGLKSANIIHGSPAVPPSLTLLITWLSGRIRHTRFSVSEKNSS